MEVHLRHGLHRLPLPLLGGELVVVPKVDPEIGLMELESLPLEGNEFTT